MNKITKHKNFQLSDTEQENIIFSNVAQIIEKRKFNAVSVANSQIVLMFWEIGMYINSVILGMERAEYGKKILSTVSTKLVANYGSPFVEVPRSAAFAMPPSILFLLKRFQIFIKNDYFISNLLDDCYSLFFTFFFQLLIKCH